MDNILIKTEPSAKVYRSYLPSAFIAAALPLRDVKRNVFERKYNNINMKLTSGAKVPYGKYGRLMLSILTTHAVQNRQSERVNNRLVITYSSITELMDELQLPRQRSGDVMEQLHAFAESSFIYEERIKKSIQKSLFKDLFDGSADGTVDATKISTGIIPFIDTFQYIEVSGRTDEPKKMIAFQIVLTEKFIELCKTHSVPINYTVFKDISSPLGKDLYVWLVYRNNFIKDSDPVFVTKQSLINQFQPVTNVNNYAAQCSINYNHIISTLETIKKKHYPELNISFDRNSNGVYLYKSPAVILPEDPRYVLVTSDIK